MRCIHCSANTGYPDRRKNNGRCKGCTHVFAFEPKTDANGMTDPFMRNAIAAVSDDGAAWFTARQLWYEVNRRLVRRKFWRKPWEGLAVAGFGGAASGLPLSLVAASTGSAAATVLAVLAVGGGVTAAVYATLMNRQAKREGIDRPRLAFNEFSARYLGPWARAHGPIERLLPPPLSLPPAPPRAVEADVTAYSFDRAVVTDRAETAALLLANNFHFEHNCAILGADGYPADRHATVMAMLRRNPALTVFALHDATPDGCLLSHRLRGTEWFPEPSVRVIDLGLRPRQAEQLRLMRPDPSPRTLDEEAHRLLPADEIAWLAAGETAELAALRPARLMRAVYQGFAAANRREGADGGIDGGLIIWGDGQSGDVYAADSFG